MAGFDWGKWLPVIIPSAAAGITGYLGYKAAGDATKAQTQSATESLNLLRDIYNTNRADAEPFRRAGNTSLGALMRGLGLPFNSGGGGMSGGGSSGPSALMSSSPFVSNLLGMNPSAWGNTLSKTLAGAGAGGMVGAQIGAIGGPLGMAAGAGVGAASTLFGRGRREADRIVPMQNAVAAEIDRINKEVEFRRTNGTLTQQDLATAGFTVQSLLDQFNTSTQDYGRAGPGARDTLSKAYNPILQGWQSQIEGLPAGDPSAQAGGDAAMGGGEYGDIPAGYFTQNFGDQFNKDRDIDPSFQFIMDEGTRALQNSAAAKGTLLSGSTAKRLQRYGSDLASREYGNAYNRFNSDRDRLFSRLSTIAGFGPTAMSANQNSANSYGSQATDLITGMGNVRAAGAMNQATALGNASGDIADSFSTQILMDQIRQQRVPISQQLQPGPWAGGYRFPG